MTHFSLIYRRDAASWSFYALWKRCCRL